MGGRLHPTTTAHQFLHLVRRGGGGSVSGEEWGGGEGGEGSEAGGAGWRGGRAREGGLGIGRGQNRLRSTNKQCLAELCYAML